jgi:hypothetical protein
MKKSNNKKINQIIKKRIQTTMIGAIARFEENFGFLWGQDKDIDLNSEQIRNLEIWEKTRTEILDNGNNQIRGAISEIKSPGNVDQVKYSYYYKVNPRRNNNED